MATSRKMCGGNLLFETTFRP